MLSEALELLIEMLYEKLCNYLEEYWEQSTLTMNDGQYSVWTQNLWPVVQEWLENTAFIWPDADVAEYEDALFSAYDGDMVMRAYSELIYNSEPPMWEIIEAAQNAQYAADALEFAGL